jgi:hypothetical protein
MVAAMCAVSLRLGMLDRILNRFAHDGTQTMHRLQG